MLTIEQKATPFTLSVEKALLFVLLISLNFQLLTVKGWDIHDGTILSHLKVYHVVTLIFALFVAIKNRITYKVHFLPFLFLAYAIIISPILYYFYTWNFLILNYIFALLIFLLFYNYSKLSFDTLDRLIRSCFIVIYLFLLFKLFIYYDKIAAFFLNPWGHPAIPVIYGGDVNLEATWIALSTTLFMRQKKWLYYFTVGFALLLSILYSSRAGTVLTVLSFLIYFFSGNISKKEKALILFCSGAFLLFTLTFLLRNIEEMYVVQRFSQIGSSVDGGSAGRLMLWENIDQALFKNFLIGYGAGNSIYAVEKVGNFDYLEDNVHNYYLQTLLDFGILGFAFYSFFCLYVIWRQLKTKFTNPYGNFILLYFIGSLIQFRGAEAILWLVVGIYFAQERNPHVKRA